MPPIDKNAPILLRLVDGRSEQEELVLERGRPIAPLTLGARASWTIEARDVADAHVMLAWNGRSLFAGTSRGEKALLDGFPLATRWTEVRMPGELRFGGARLTIERCTGAEPTAAPPAERETRLAHVHHVTAGAGRRLLRDDEETCPDPERVQAALKLAREGEATCIADIVVPPAARRPPGARPLPADSDRTLVAVLVAPR